MEFTPSSRMWFVSVVLLSTFMSVVLSIRVDFGTNTGPIRPPTSTPLPPPRPPFREPAPVWEDQSNDIPNPNPYVYVPPPPSRPRYNQFNDIETNQISNDIDPYSNAKYNPYAPPNPKGFFLDIPPKYYKNPAKQQYYQQQYLNEFLKYLNSKQIKYNVVAIKSKYHNVPYYVFYFGQVSPQ